MRCPGVLTALVLILPSLAWAAPFADATGRTVDLPDPIERVFPAGPPAGVLVYVLKPQALIGWTHAPKAGDKPYLLAATRDLPELPPLTDAGMAGLRQSENPDLILDFGTVTESYVATVEKTQTSTGIPALLLDGSLDQTPAALRDLGAALGVPDRGEALATYARETLDLVDATVAKVPTAERPRFYLARGDDGLKTARRGSINTEALERVGAINVVDATTPGNLVTATPQMIADWSPDIIVTVSSQFAEQAASSPAWNSLPAVAKGEIIVSPSRPFGFVDSPPSVNRLIGVRWLLHRLYPTVATGDLRAEVREFYDLFYQTSLDDAALDALLSQ